MGSPKELHFVNHKPPEEEMNVRIDRGLCPLLLSLALVLLLTSCGGGGGDSAGLPPPKAVTMPATNVRIDNAVLNGVVNPNGQATNAWFEWGIDNAALTGRSPDFPKGSGTTDNQVVFTATGLTQKTTYYFRIAAINSAGMETQGEIRSFSTPPLPTVTTGGPTEITTNSAKLNGEVNPNGLQTNAWFEWGNGQQSGRVQCHDRSADRQWSYKAANQRNHTRRRGRGVLLQDCREKPGRRI